jgi:hypothetical protein
MHPLSNPYFHYIYAPYLKYILSNMFYRHTLWHIIYMIKDMLREDYF